ncbi:MAG TPA: ABC transporter substrate-binding protein [Candidatus Pacearchaeota archaeon]|nr:ABC transporter substrate-binding protein [Candidatus Pacearchaeota archaeon]HOK94338.1 ABC transporter substrate-binding protein [Candidatus Pacearchaeota archaeon]HPO75289.1 ABC transporter substrate-binding protein [Candidatus Pacearchaeota archaeon]
MFFSFLALAVTAGMCWWRLDFLENTKVVAADGGILKEAIIGQPQSLNPLFAMLNNADQDIVELTFSGLLEYTNDGELKESLAKEYQISEDGKTYQFTLKDNLLWSDGEPITADDVLFTIETIKNPKVQSPLRLTWQDVKVEKVDEKTIKFSLKEPYSPFLENFTLKILPSHVLKDIDPQELSLSQQKISTISSGPFKIKTIERDKENKIKKIIFEKNQKFYGKSPFLLEVELTFVNNENELLKLKNNETSLANISPENKNKLRKEFKTYSLFLPRYFALFLNQENAILSQKEVREALALATPKEEIIKEVLMGEGRIVDGPFFEENRIGEDFKKYEFNLEEAKKVLDDAGWKDTNNDGIREKTLKEGESPISLELNLFTINQPQLQKTAEIIQKNWQEIGVKLNINALEGEKLYQNNIIERNYDILLFAQGLYMIADPSSFWHSTQKEYPGLNLSLYQQDEVDELLEASIKETDFTKRNEILKKFGQKLTEDIPAIFLYSPNYLYAVNKKVKGIQTQFIVNSSKRFIDIENWYINEKRVPLSN